MGEFNTAGQLSVDIRLCIPTEVYHQFLAVSTNPAKDFEREIVLQWLPKELTFLASRRFQLYLRLYYPQYHDNLMDRGLIEEINKEMNGYNSLKILNEFMPKKIKNGLGFYEESIIYLLRHTQLNPRHTLLILNNIFGRERKTSMDKPIVSRNDIVKGVAASERILTAEIFRSFAHVYPNAREIVERCIPELGFRFEYSSLENVFNRIGKNIYQGNDIHGFVRLLLEMGIIGKNVESKHPREHYYEALYEYIVSNKLNYSTSDRFCIHPLFLKEFSARRRPKDQMTVYPFGISPEIEEDYALKY